MSDKEIKLERKYIDVDTTYENVLEWAEEGHTLVFLSKPELFLELSAAQVKELPTKTKTSYNMAKNDFKNQTKAFIDPDLEFLSASVEYGSATEQLNVVRDPKSTKEIKWVRPEQIKDYSRNGWNIVKDDMESQRGLRDSGYHMIGKKELILMEISKVKFAALEKKKQERHTQLFDQNAEDMKRVAHSMNAVGTFETSTEDINIPLT
jgi:hypothetical protein